MSLNYTSNLKTSSHTLDYRPSDYLKSGSRLIGFEELFKTISELEKPVSGFPPYNIIRVTSTKFKITLAVAGFSKKDISVTLENGSLSIAGSVNQQVPVQEYIYKGIAERNFKRDFTVADTVEVTNVTLIDGILTVNLNNVIPEYKKLKTFTID